MPASAAVDLGSFDANCVSGTSVISLTGSVGDTFSVTNTSATSGGQNLSCYAFYAGGLISGASAISYFVPAPNFQTYTLAAPGTGQASFTNPSTGKGLWINLTVIGTPPSPPQPGGSAAAETGPAPVHQALPVPVSGSCADIEDAALAWGTGLTGGWRKSWEPWVSANGGWACSRTLVNTGSTWAIANQ